MAIFSGDLHVVGGDLQLGFTGTNKISYNLSDIIIDSDRNVYINNSLIVRGNATIDTKLDFSINQTLCFKVKSNGDMGVSSVC